jgi:hypothetical protein
MTRAAAGLVTISLLLAVRAEAQGGFQFLPRVQTEARIETIVASSPSVLAGFGFNVPAGYFTRVGSNVSAGRVLGDSTANTARAELVARFLADPFREGRWGFYGGGGVGVIWTEGLRGRASFVLTAGVDFPGRSGWPPSLEVAVGGGLRAALVFRPARRAGR